MNIFILGFYSPYTVKLKKANAIRVVNVNRNTFITSTGQGKAANQTPLKTAGEGQEMN